MGRLRMTLEQETPPKHWMGAIPKKCDLCGKPLKGTFVDGRMLTAGSWAIMCTACFMLYGAGLGTGKGQLYNILGEKLKG